MVHPNKTLVYKRYTDGWPVPGEHLAVESRPFEPEAPPPAGGFTVKNHYLSIDPYQRGQIRQDTGATYSLPWTEGQPAIVSTLSTVLKSDNPQVKPGDLVTAMAGAGEYAAVPPILASMTRVYPPLPPGVNIPAPALIGALGIAGLSAYVSFKEYVHEPYAGKTLFISAASGCVGQIVGQMAKMNGMKSGAWNYKTEKTADALKRLAPEGIDIYYDNVGGEQLETTLYHMKDFGQIIASGMVSVYNDPDAEKYGVKSLMEIVFRRLTINGFICSDPKHLRHMPGFAKDMVAWLIEGKSRPKKK